MEDFCQPQGYIPSCMSRSQAEGLLAEFQQWSGESIRVPEYDRRIKRGDDFAGDAWRDRDGNIFYVSVGVNPNEVKDA